MKKYRIFLFLCLLVIIIYMVITYENNVVIDTTESLFTENISCFWSKSNGILELGRGEWDDAMLIPDSCVFFHEFSCSEPILSPREACAVESAARNNPFLNVFLLYLSSKPFTEGSAELQKILESYSNVYIRRIRLSSFLKGTPLEDWYQKRVSELIEDDEWLPSRIADYIRLLTVWKFGGISLNLDSVVQSRLDKLSNFAGMTDLKNMDVGVFGFEISRNFGRELANSCINFVKSTQIDHNWNHNLTFIFTKALHSLCSRGNTSAVDCQEMLVYKPDTFYPVPAKAWKNYFREYVPQQTRIAINEASIIHVWSKYSKDTKIFVKSLGAYNLAARKHCPKVHEHCHLTF